MHAFPLLGPLLAAGELLAVVSLHNPARVQPVCISFALDAPDPLRPPPAAAALRAACSSRGEFLPPTEGEGPAAAASRLNRQGACRAL
jgi:hypothetical protein